MVEQDTVVGWLEQQRITEYDTDPGPLEEGFLWAVTFRPENRYRVVIGQRHVQWNDLAMQISVTISDDHREGLEALDQDTREMLWYDLRIALLQKPVGYSLDFSGDEENELLAGVNVGYRLLEDNLTKAGFFRRHHQLQSASTLAIQLLKKAIRFGEW